MIYFKVVLIRNQTTVAISNRDGKWYNVTIYNPQTGRLHRAASPPLHPGLLGHMHARLFLKNGSLFFFIMILSVSLLSYHYPLLNMRKCSCK